MPMLWYCASTVLLPARHNMARQARDTVYFGVLERP